MLTTLLAPWTFLAAVAAWLAPVPQLAERSPVGVKKTPGPETGGAVLGLGNEGAFDAVWATCPSVLFDGKLYRMWYSSYYDSHMGRGGIGFAISRDGIHWKRENGGRPVLTTGLRGAFDDGQVMGPQVLYEKGEYWMWYTGMKTEWHRSGVGFYRIGLARSKDGINWERLNKGRPVLDVGPRGAYDEVQCATPSIVREKTGLRMWYAAWAPKPGHTLCSARSRDGLNWRREEQGKPVRGLLSGGAYGPAVVRIGSEYLLLYMGAGEASSGLYAATSRDGRQWKATGNSALLARGARPAFDSSLAGHASLLLRDDRLMTWYTGYRREAGGPYGWKLRIGAAQIDLARVSRDRGGDAGRSH